MELVQYDENVGCWNNNNPVITFRVSDIPDDFDIAALSSSIYHSPLYHTIVCVYYKVKHSGIVSILEIICHVTVSPAILGAGTV